MTPAELTRALAELDSLGTPGAAQLAARMRRRFDSPMSRERHSINLRDDDYPNIVKAAAMYGPLGDFTVQHNPVKHTVRLTYNPGTETPETLFPAVRQAIDYLNDYAAIIRGSEDESTRWAHANLTALISQLQAATGAAKHTSKRD